MRSSICRGVMASFIIYCQIACNGYLIEGRTMQLWLQWWSVVAPLRQTCRDKRSFLWLGTALAGLCVRPDLLGLSSTVRALGLAARCYDRLLNFFHSPAIAP